MTTKKDTFAKLVLQGLYGSPLSPAYPSPNDARELNALLDVWEIQTASLLEGRIPEWPELQVLMAFVWPCDESFEGSRVRYIKSERLLEISFCVQAEEFKVRSPPDLARLLAQLALEGFIAGFRQLGYDPRTLARLREKG